MGSEGAGDWERGGRGKGRGARGRGAGNRERGGRDNINYMVKIIAENNVFLFLLRNLMLLSASAVLETVFFF